MATALERDLSKILEVLVFDGVANKVYTFGELKCNLTHEALRADGRIF